MKKLLIISIIPFCILFAANKKMDGCVEQKLNEKTSLYACPQALLEVTFAIKRSGKNYVREEDESPTIRIISETKAQIVKVNQK